jgi:hypothetical protein
MADYGSPMGTEAPGSVKRERPRAKEASPAERRAALKALEERSAGEARRSNTPGRGTSQGSGGAKSEQRGNIADVIRDKKYRDMKTIDEAG